VKAQSQQSGLKNGANVTQEFHLSITAVGDQRYLVRTEQVTLGVPLAEEIVTWPVAEWLAQTQGLLHDPLISLLRNQSVNRVHTDNDPEASQDTAPTSLAQFGRVLYRSLFQNTIRDSWLAALSIAQNRRERLRLRLAAKDPQLQRLPWEILYDCDQDRPLATRTEVTFARYHPTGSPALSLIDGATALRVLMVMATPEDQDPLDTQQEFQQLQTDLQETSAIAIEVDLLAHPDRAQLTQHLEQGHYQIFHYAGHSSAAEAGGDLYLVNRTTGLTERLSGEDLAGLLVNNGVSLAVFNSCRGAYGSDHSHEHSLVQALVTQGVPGVIAMAERIPDDAALNFTRLLYRNLRQGYPIDLSLSRTRQGLISTYGSERFYWALPVLYLQPGAATTGTTAGPEAAFPHPSARGYTLDGLGFEDLDPDLNQELDQELAQADLFDDLEPDDLLEDDLLEADLPEEDLEDDLLEADLAEDFTDDLDDYGDDSAVVADLIQQLSQPRPEPPPMPAQPEEQLLEKDAGTDQTVLDLYDPLPEGPVAAEPAIAADSRTSPLKGRLFQPGEGLTRLGWGVFGGVSLGLAVLLGFGLSLEAMRTEPDLPPPPTARDPELDGNGLDAPFAAGMDAQALKTLAIAELNQDRPEGAARAIRLMLDKGELREVGEIFTNLDGGDNQVSSQPELLFLKGRLQWQHHRQGDTDFPAHEVQDTWERVVALKPNNPRYQTALGFAAYANEDFPEASAAWTKATDLDQATLQAHQSSAEAGDGEQALTPDREGIVADPLVLHAYAGLALVSRQDAQQETNENSREILLGRAQKFARMVDEADARSFTRNQLGNHWLWDEAAIADWLLVPR
jgi:hypothetical protein